MMENLQIDKEILLFILDAKFDETEAEQYLRLDKTKEAYGASELLKPDDANDPEEKDFQNHIISIVCKHIKEFRTTLITMIRPLGDPLTGYQITKSQEQLFVILNDS